MVNAYRRFNSWFAILLMRGTSTMECAYLFAILAFIGAPYGDPNPSHWVQWTSSTFIQLTMLSVIMVAQKLLDASTKQLHDAHQELHELHRKHHRQIQEVLKHVKKNGKPHRSK